MYILILLLALPFVEIAILIKVGNYIGLLATLGFLFTTAVIGIILIRKKGLKTLFIHDFAQEINDSPVDEMIKSMIIVIAGVMLIIPGFSTDIIGLLLLIPLIQNFTKKFIFRQTYTQKKSKNKQKNVIEGEFTEIDGQ